ncbi:similar to Saccharomyces cerevisiae YOR188W MSB1 Protein involved in positive regulation of both 1,3-beta-glucan synthesis and the Pkc1p-MAPK pathway, potential Cdc28p substrate [Maudiozyma saulgeensis]|uniref:Similar to Saccharomyces cerevisiae YOR188W MSB1 Protein involved in positive regulation of both 1,3-beta-glucan synthesis and the Pkc1p-MAPK pathway, potential Cdc28p substrate n=1 Tax=Maudiozyma saulgeensis TaxID=1789683 RepID=A0A1X7R093_9SACH|nr:similar to Saccharomyces cerevisiae YOR188W MSB1 Protein involved in positive regulation of both 1,3-beta-glucan synthesis and the Pkc1p-MAPK pathway, potential Cdc28p substrate [Kazachstania saulgeensis]
MEQIVKPLPDTPLGPSGSPSKSEHSKHVSSRHSSPRRDTGNDKKQDDDDEEFEFFHKFDREKIKGVIHLITSELKERGADVEYIMIPFRPEQTNEKLLKFLNQLFPMGNGQPVNKKLQQKVITKTEVWTLFQGLKYIWCRLPNSEIIGWKSYLEFKYREADKDYPQKAFLEIMPQCLESSNHASIVYDFFDLIVTLASNSKINKMSARKISKMCAIWAFNKPTKDDSAISTANNLDFDSNASGGILPKYKKVNNTFQDGLAEWVPASDAMFHLLLAFLKSFVPKDLESAKLPRALKSILFNNEYPPKDSTAYTSETILTIPLVTLYTDQFSRKPWQLLEKCNDLLDFSDYDAFEAREDYALLKSLFKKKKNVEGISRKMSQESRRLMKAMSTKHSTFQAGWAPRKCLENINHLEENIQVKRVDIDDYFIWTWLSSLSYEETSEKKKIFGRSVILEFEFDGFKKWVCFQESDITLDYNSQSQLKDKRNEERTKSRNASPAKSKKSTSSSSLDRKEPVALPKIRDQSRSYDNFKSSNESTTRTSSAQSTGQYHTKISLDSLNKNGKQQKSSFDKISKWNPLHNLRKKSNSSVGASVSSSNYEDRIPSRGGYIENESTDNNLNKNVNPVVNNTNNYELPPIETDGFKIDLPDINPDMIVARSSYQQPYPDTLEPRYDLTSDSVSEKRKTMQSNPNTIEEINEMVENMITDEIAENPSLDSEIPDPFKNVTKFDQYKPSALRDPDMETSLSSTVQSLKISSPQDATPTHDRNGLNFKQNNSNSTINLNKGQQTANAPQKNVSNQQYRSQGPSGGQYGTPTKSKQHGSRDNNMAGYNNYTQPPNGNGYQNNNVNNQERAQVQQPPKTRDIEQPYSQYIPQQQQQQSQERGRSHGQPMSQNVPIPHNGKSRSGNAIPNGNFVPPAGPQQGVYNSYGGSPSRSNESPMRQGRAHSPVRQQPRSSSPMRNPNIPNQYMGSPSPGYYNGNMPAAPNARSSSPMRQNGMGYPQMGPPQGQYNNAPKKQVGPQYSIMPPPVQSPSMQFNNQMSPQQRTQGFNQQMPMAPNYGSPQFQQGAMPMAPMGGIPMGGMPAQGYNQYGTAPPNTIPMQMPHGGANKLHGNANKRQDRRQLYDNIRSGNFGI